MKNIELTQQTVEVDFTDLLEHRGLRCPEFKVVSWPQDPVDAPNLLTYAIRLPEFADRDKCLGYAATAIKRALLTEKQEDHTLTQALIDNLVPLTGCAVSADEVIYAKRCGYTLLRIQPQTLRVYADSSVYKRHEDTKWVPCHYESYSIQSLMWLDFLVRAITRMEGQILAGDWTSSRAAEFLQEFLSMLKFKGVLRAFDVHCYYEEGLPHPVRIRFQLDRDGDLLSPVEEWNWRPDPTLHARTIVETTNLTTPGHSIVGFLRQLYPDLTILKIDYEKD